jgi:SAM-dependent methyltransferase
LWRLCRHKQRPLPGFRAKPWICNSQAQGDVAVALDGSRRRNRAAPRENPKMNNWKGIDAGTIDWHRRWREMYDAERAQGEAATDPNFARYADYWATRARQFAAASERHPQPDGFMRWLLPHLQTSDTVVDIGAGTGRYVPVLASAVRRVVALEPSPAMRAELTGLIERKQLTNIEINDNAWPAPEPIAGDVLFSAHVVYGVREIGPFLEAMHRSARRICVLYLGLQHPSAILHPFWECIHGEVRYPLPAALEALACLHQMGIYASMELVPHPAGFRFSNFEEALGDIRMRLRVAPDPQRDERIIAAAREFLVPHPDGGIAAPGQPAYAAVIHWSPASGAVDQAS